MKFLIKVCHTKDIKHVLETIQDFDYNIKDLKVLYDTVNTEQFISIDFASDSTIGDLEEIFNTILEKHSQEIEDIDTVIEKLKY
jgi:archaellum component FlaC